MLAPDDVGRIAELARHYRVPVLSDEIYRRFLYEGEFASIASLPGMKPQTDHPGRLLEVLRDDRLAARLRRDAASRWPSTSPAS